MIQIQLHLVKFWHETEFFVHFTPACIPATVVNALLFYLSAALCSAGLQADLHKLQQPRHLSQRDKPWERRGGACLRRYHLIPSGGGRERGGGRGVGGAFQVALVKRGPGVERWEFITPQAERMLYFWTDSGITARVAGVRRISRFLEEGDGRQKGRLDN